MFLTWVNGYTDPTVHADRNAIFNPLVEESWTTSPTPLAHFQSKSGFISHFCIRFYFRWQCRFSRTDSASIYLNKSVYILFSIFILIARFIKQIVFFLEKRLERPFKIFR